MLAAITVAGTTATAIFAGRVGTMHRSVASDRRFIEQSLRPGPPDEKGSTESLRIAPTLRVPPGG